MSIKGTQIGFAFNHKWFLKLLRGFNTIYNFKTESFAKFVIHIRFY